MIRIDAVRAVGPDGIAAVDQAATVRWLGRAFGVPAELIRDIPDLSMPDLGLEALAGDASDLIADLIPDLVPGLNQDTEDSELEAADG